MPPSKRQTAAPTEAVDTTEVTPDAESDVEVPAEPDVEASDVDADVPDVDGVAEVDADDPKADYEGIDAAILAVDPKYVRGVTPHRLYDIRRADNGSFIVRVPSIRY